MTKTTLGGGKGKKTTSNKKKEKPEGQTNRTLSARFLGFAETGVCHPTTANGLDIRLM